MVPATWDLGLLMLMIVIGSLLGALSVLFRAAPYFLNILILIFLLLGVFWFVLGIKAAIARRALSHLSSDSADWTATIESVLIRAGNVLVDKHRLRPRFNVLTEVARALYTHGERGSIWRFNVPKDTIEKPSPLIMPFEPVPLEAKSAVFQEFTGRRASKTDKWQQAVEVFVSSCGQSLLARGFGYIVLALMLIGLLLVLGQSMLQLIRGEPTSFINVAIIMCVLMAIGLVMRAWQPQQWFLVPGAIVVRSSTWSRSTWDVYVMPQRESVLLYWRRVRQLVVIGPEGTLFSRGAGPLEAEFAMRAFSSPLPPPTTADLSDLN